MVFQRNSGLQNLGKRNVAAFVLHLQMVRLFLPYWVRIQTFSLTEQSVWYTKEPL